MRIPTREDFLKYAKKGNLVPVYGEMLADMDTPVSALLKLGETPSFLFESVEGGEKWARYSFVGFGPSKVLRGHGRSLEITDREGTRTIEIDDPLEYIKAALAAYRPVEVEGLPRFFGGLVGYIGYDVVRFIEEKIPDRNPDPLAMPDVYLMLTDTMLVFDNLRQKIKVVSCVHLDGRDPSMAYDEAVRKVAEVMARLKRPLKYAESEARKPSAEEFSSMSGPREAFEGAVVRAKEYIKAGDIFQVVLSQRFRRATNASAINIYRALRTINPSPYMFYLNMGDAHVVGSSPEILVRLEGRDITLRPIAGTRRRGRSAEEDAAMEEELKRDPKERAEHVMLVDLGRNDVGRVAAVGTVRVRESMAIERYSHVMHMVSSVEGSLGEGRDAIDVFRATFPAGTVSGAPKIRSMEIIEELEPLRRGAYAGAVGYFSYSGNMDTCITIRTLIVKDGVVYVQAGAGIVADSDPALEYDETVNKARGMMRAVEMAERELAEVEMAREKMVGQEVAGEDPK